MSEEIKSFWQKEKLWNDCVFYSDPLKKAYTAFKPCRYFRKMSDSGAESFRMRAGFRDIQIIKFDMMKLYGINTKEMNRLFGRDNEAFISLALAGSMASVCAYKLVFLRMLGFDMHGRPAQKCIGAGKVYYVFIDSKVWENLNDRNKSFFLLHEVGHIILGHLDNPNCLIDGNGMIIDPDYERQANGYAQGLCGKKADLKNAKYAIIEGNELLKYICEKEGTKIEDLTLNLLNNY